MSRFFGLGRRNDDDDESDEEKKRREEARKRGDSVWREGPRADFNRDENTPQFQIVWGTCEKCHSEGWANKTLYGDGTVYYSCQRNQRHRDCFKEHPPTAGGAERRKHPDKPLRELEGDIDPEGTWVRPSNPSGESRDRYGNTPAESEQDAYCPKCRKDVKAQVISEGRYVRAYCKNCGHKLGPNQMR